MGKALKWLAAIVLGLVIIAGIAVGILLALLDEDTLKGQLTRVAHDATGGELKIDGELGLSLYPQLGVAVEQVHFTPRDEQEPLASIATMRLGVDFMPLFSGQISVGEINLQGLQLNLLRATDGSGNWENLSASEPATPPANAKVPQSTETTAAEASTMTLAISQLQITDTDIHYRDLQSGEDYHLGDFNLNSQGVNLAGGSFPANISFKVDSKSPQLQLGFELDTQLSGDLQAQILELQSTKATIDIVGEPTGNIPLNLELAANARIDLQKDIASLQNLAITLDQLKLSGKFAVTQLSTDPQLQGNLQSQPFNPRQLASDLQQDMPEFVNDTALTELRFASDISYGSNKARLENLNIVLDKTQLNGTVTVADIEKQALVVKLAIDQINLDEYQLVVTDEPAATASNNAPAAKAKPGAQQGQAITPLPIVPVDTLKTLNLDAYLKLGKLTAAGLELTDAAMLMRAKGGLVDISSLTAKLYQGTTDFKMSIDVRPATPLWTFKGDVAKVQVGPMMAAVSDIDWVEGSFGFSGQLTTRGNTDTALKKNLLGPASFSLNNGTLRQMNLEKTVCQAIAVVNGKRLSKPFGPDTTLKTISGKLQFGDGQLNNTAFTAGLENTSVKGSGTIGLLDDKVDYRMGIRVIGEMEDIDPACEVNKRYKDIYWPLRCEGSLDDEPSKLCGVDNERMNEVVKKMAEEEIRKRASGAVNDALKRLLNR